MYEEESHLVLVPADDPLLQELVERDGVESETDDEQDSISNNGDDLCIAKHHVLGQAEVGRDKD